MNTERFRYRQRDFHLKQLDNLTNIDWSLESMVVDQHLLLMY